MSLRTRTVLCLIVATTSPACTTLRTITHEELTHDAVEIRTRTAWVTTPTETREVIVHRVRDGGVEGWDVRDRAEAYFDRTQVRGLVVRLPDRTATANAWFWGSVGVLALGFAVAVPFVINP